MHRLLPSIGVALFCVVAAAGGQTPPPQPPATVPPGPGSQAPAPAPPDAAVPAPATPRKQPPAPSAPPPPPVVATAPDARVFASEAGVILNPIKPDKTADFEAVLARLKEALRLSDDKVRRQQALGWRVYRAAETAEDGTVYYLFLIDPVVKGADYTVSKVLRDAFPTEVDALQAKFLGAYAGGQSLLNLHLVINLNPAR